MFVFFFIISKIKNEFNKHPLWSSREKVLPRKEKTWMTSIFKLAKEAIEQC